MFKIYIFELFYQKFNFDKLFVFWQTICVLKQKIIKIFLYYDGRQDNKKDDVSGFEKDRYTQRRDRT